ncbi:hypothetical protein ACIBPB_26615 [Micromonospora sp. NPDC049836]|uniref:hypothetical protein n=1 Tax=Micromonospora sp. NPDC049836 TaxID=3364274 RepID=UPI0037A07161
MLLRRWGAPTEADTISNPTTVDAEPKRTTKKSTAAKSEFAPKVTDKGRLDHVVVDPHRLELLARLRHPHDQRATPMQINTRDLPAVVLCLYEGPPSL